MRKNSEQVSHVAEIPQIDLDLARKNMVEIPQTDLDLSQRNTLNEKTHTSSTAKILSYANKINYPIQ